MEYGDLLADFSKRLGGTAMLEPDVNGAVELEIGGMVVSILQPAETEQVVLLGEVGVAPSSERLFRTMLRANHLFAETAGATLSLAESDHGDIVTLCRPFPLALLDGESFLAEMVRFVQTLTGWRDLVINFQDSDADPESEPQPKPEEGMVDPGLLV